MSSPDDHSRARSRPLWRNALIRSSLNYHNQVELWFAKIQRDLLARGIFSSLADLGRKIRKYIHAYARVAKPFPLVLLRSATQNSS